MVGNSQLSVMMAEFVLFFLLSLAVLRVIAIAKKRYSSFARRRASRAHRTSFASLLAAVFGALAVVSLGIVLPLAWIDGALGGTNLTNLLQSLLTICSFWFFRTAVRAVALPGTPTYRVEALLGALTAIAIPFFMISDRGPTSAQFMAEHSDQLANVAYNTIYMVILCWIVVDMIWALRGHAQAVYGAFRCGLALVALSCVDEIMYVWLAFAAPGAVADVLYHLFYALFFGGILIVALGWLWVLVTERGYAQEALWRARSSTLIAILLRARRRARLEAQHFTQGPPKPLEETVPTGGTSPRLKVERYVSPQPIPLLSVVPTDTVRDIVRTLLLPNAEDVAYRLVIQIRNTATRHLISLSPRDNKRLAVIEDKFPGFDDA